MKKGKLLLCGLGILVAGLSGGIAIGQAIQKKRIKKIGNLCVSQDKQLFLELNDESFEQMKDADYGVFQIKHLRVIN